MRTSIPEIPEVAARQGLLTRLKDMLLDNTEVLQKLDPRMLKGAGLEHIAGMDPDTLRKSDIHALSTKDLDDSNVPLSLASYLHWTCPSRDPLPFDELLPHAKVTTWLFSIFFKIATPADRSRQVWEETIYPPLNFTIFFRILIRLHQFGYPAHWLSEALVQILEGEVSTSARSPETSPLSIVEAQRTNPIERLKTAPFVMEMATLTAMFLAMLPFAVMTNVLPDVGQIYEYSIAFELSIYHHRGIGLPVFPL
ncbi:MAG: hypothetical protein Q9183_007652, partial [Haloplaca sp. 2 TL-2023]